MNPGTDWIEQGRRLLEALREGLDAPAGSDGGRALLRLPLVPGLPGRRGGARRAAGGHRGPRRRPGDGGHAPCGPSPTPPTRRHRRPTWIPRRTAARPPCSGSTSRDRRRRSGAGRTRHRHRRDEGRRRCRRARRHDRRDRAAGHPGGLGRRHRGRDRRRRRGTRGRSRRRTGRRRGRGRGLVRPHRRHRPVQPAPGLAELHPAQGPRGPAAAAALGGQRRRRRGLGRVPLRRGPRAPTWR